MKVALARSRPCRWYDENSRPLTTSLPYYEGDNGGYVHMVRSAHLHYRDGVHTHTSYKFWCSGVGFIYPRPPKPSDRRGGRGIGSLREAPSPGRVVCATCMGRAVGSGQHPGRLQGKWVKFSPRHGFLRDPKAKDPRA